MRSYVIQIKAIDNFLFPASNGYLLFSCLSNLMRNSPLDKVFHSDEGSGKKSISLSFLKRDLKVKSFLSEDLTLSAGESLYSRVSFINDSDGSAFAEIFQKRTGEAIRLGQARFTIEKILSPGDITGALALSTAQLQPVSPFKSVGLHFIPTSAEISALISNSNSL